MKEKRNLKIDIEEKIKRRRENKKRMEKRAQKLKNNL